jgi:hypothetical protein
MKKSFALLTAAAFGLTLGTASADEATNTAPRLQQPGPATMVVAISKEQEKESERREKRREKREKKREKKEKIKEKERRLKIKEKEVDRK